MRKRFWASGFVCALALAGCGGGAPDDADPVLHVYVSLPGSGAGRDAADGARLAFADAAAAAGDPELQVEFLDPPASAGEVGANARAATHDSTAIAYLGEFESGATRTSLPITNAAGLLQVSPASAAMDLVEATPGSEELPVTQAGGTRTFGRVIPGDEAQARAGAAWAAALPARPIATVSDGSAFGDTMVDAFEAALPQGLLAGDGAGLVYYGGAPGRRPAAPRLLVTDAELVPRTTRQRDGTRATAAALYPGYLPPAGRQFARDFAAEFGRPAGPYAAYGYEAMAVVLDAIARASEPTDRAAVVDAFFATTERDSVLGSYSIDELGQTTLARMTAYEYRGGTPRPVRVIEPR